jgi:hypothetical protein
MDSAAPTGRQVPANAAEARRRLEEGNDSFAGFLTAAHDSARRPAAAALRRSPGMLGTSIILDAALTASILREEFGEPTTDRRILFGVYDLGCRRVQVHLPDAKGEAGATRLLEAPASRDDLGRFAAEVVEGRWSANSWRAEALQEFAGGSATSPERQRRDSTAGTPGSWRFAPR